jgi:HAD hydrolase, family IA, variant 1
VTADDGFPRKPDPTSMLYLKDKYTIESGLVIGDRPIDIEAGQRAGMATYLFDSMDQLSAYIFN